MRKKACYAALITAGALLLSGCAVADDAGPAAAETAPATVPLDVGFTAPSGHSGAAPDGDWMLTVVDVEGSAHDGFDRITFTLEGDGTPGWRVEYVDEALDDGMGTPVELGGDAVLSVRIAGVGMPFETGVEEFAIGRVAVGGQSVVDFSYRSVFEGYATTFLGVEEARPFRVTTAEDPLRVIVDVQH